jgi:hypothetical protein
VFWSKIWFFLVAIVAALAITIALVLPRPAERAHAASERQRLAVACSVVGILLEDAARERVELASSFSRAKQIVAALDEAGGVAEIDRARADKLRDVATEVLRPKDGVAPDLAVLIDRKGRAVTRVGADAGDYGDTVAGRPLVDDALAGYMRDDLWLVGDQLYLVAAAPVVQRDGVPRYVGAAVVGYKTSNKFAEKLVTSLDVGIGFYVGGDRMAASGALDFGKDAIVAGLGKVKGDDYRADCKQSEPFDLRSGSDSYTAVLARLPGEAGAKQASYAISIPRPKAIGFKGTLDSVRSDDLSFKSFPWIGLGAALLVTLAIGLALMVLESDRPLRRLNADALRLAKGEQARLGEEQHRGKFGSIARSVNIHVDKVAREAKAAKQDLDQLLGPASDDALAAAASLGAVDLLAAPGGQPAGGAAAVGVQVQRAGAVGANRWSAAEPAGRVAGADRPGGRAAASRAPAGRAACGAARRARPPRPLCRRDRPRRRRFVPPRRRHSSEAWRTTCSTPLRPRGRSATRPPRPPTSKRSSTSSWRSSVRAASRSRASRSPSSLASCARTVTTCGPKTGCVDVKFTVYVKDGKAALKATPVKD